MARVREAREQRAEAIVELMRADGVDVTWAEVLEYAGGGTVGRPHLAQALIRRGLVATVSEAFAPSMLGQRWRVPKADTDVFLAARARPRRRWRPRLRPSAGHQARRVVPDSLIVEMAAQGLFGLEADHEDHTPQERAEVRALAADLGLVVTGSSDFHGTNKTVAARREPHRSGRVRPHPRRPAPGPDLACPAARSGATPARRLPGSGAGAERPGRAGWTAWTSGCSARCSSPCS